jgi:CRP-like cAMP-binding protein
MGIYLNEGEPAPDFYVIASGEIKVSKLYKNQSVPLDLL